MFVETSASKHGLGRMRKGLTARTLNNDVLPAFCKPIMVMSISVALNDGVSQRPPLVMFAQICFFIGMVSMSNGASGIEACVQGIKADIPEKAQQPVVDASEEVRHVDGRAVLMTGESWCCRRAQDGDGWVLEMGILDPCDVLRGPLSG
jgi:hypothetical protein